MIDLMRMARVVLKSSSIILVCIFLPIILSKSAILSKIRTRTTNRLGIDPDIGVFGRRHGFDLEVWVHIIVAK